MTDEISRIGAKIEQGQSLVMLSRFPKPFLKKRFGRMRLVVEERRLSSEDTLVCLVRLMFRGDADYGRFLDEPSSLCSTYTVDEAEAMRYVAACKVRGVGVARERLSRIEQSYLFCHAATPHEDLGTVLETIDWVQGIQDERRKDYRFPLGELVESLATAPPADESILRHPQYPQVGVLFRYFPETRHLLLIAPVSGTDEEVNMRRRYADLFAGADGQVADALRRCRRAYPAIITIDRDMWLRAESTTDANLALSPEENAIVEQVRATVAGQGAGAYPLFINGRPGSGKSTILQYLFADALFYHLTRVADEQLSAPPLYLTYSTSLLVRAQKVVEDILRCDALKQLDGSALTLDSVRAAFPGCFANFRDFLRAKLPVSERAKFSDDGFVDFPRFRLLWHTRFDHAPDRVLRTIGAELAWHVIRTYIKGMQEDDGDEGLYFDPDCYREHPAKRKSVTDERFGSIYERIFKAWYLPLCEREGYWDDQDLVRRVLCCDPEALSRHPGIFCDEAQDFTHLELQLIFQLSLYSRRRVPKHDLHRVPFAFAGDPFQTLNPTGFTWSGVQADFHEKIIENLDRSESRALDFNFHELKLNYRSGDTIVKICNSIQIARAVLFRIRGIEPQKTWFLDPAPVPAYFDVEDPIIHKTLETQEEIVIIVPCHEGGELEFVQNDEFLARIALQGDRLCRNVLSPMRAKGLEFQRVVLYGFGSHAIDYVNIAEALQNLRPLETTLENLLPAEYYFNQLYVGASRARKTLLIVDTKSAMERFWSLFSRQDGAQRLLDSYQTVEPDAVVRLRWSTADLGRLATGGPAGLEEGRDDQREVADKFFEQGRDKQDVYFLELARNLYQRIGDRVKTDECYACTLELEGKHLLAGRLYLTLRQLSAATRCFWKASAWNDLLRLEPEIGNSPEIVAARFMASRNSAACTRLLGELLELSGRPETKARLLTDVRWLDITGILVDTLAGAADAEPPEFETWAQVYAQLDALRDVGMRILDSASLARVAYRAGNMAAVVKIWRSAAPKIEAPRWLTEALSMVEPYPSNLEHLARLHRHHDIIRVFEQHKDVRIGDTASRNVREAAMHAGWTPATLALTERDPQKPHLASALLGPATDVLRPHAEAAVVQLLKLLDRDAAWDELVAMARERLIGGKTAGEGSLLKTLDAGRLMLLTIRTLARSTTLVEVARNAHHKRVQEFLQAEVLDLKNLSRSGCSIHEAAAAIERTGQFTQALEFYEHVDNDDAIPAELKTFARERWLLNKQRQIDGYSAKNQGRSRREFDKARQSWHISTERLQKLPRYPEVPREERTPPSLRHPEPKHTPPEPPSSPRGGLSFWHNGREFLVKHRSDLRKLELREPLTDVSIVVRGTHGDVRSAELADDLTAVAEDGGQVYHVRAWDVSIALIMIDGRLRMQVRGRSGLLYEAEL